MTRSPVDPRPSAKKDRIDALAETSAGGPHVGAAGKVKDTGGVSLIASAWARSARVSSERVGCRAARLPSMRSSLRCEITYPSANATVLGMRPDRRTSASG